MKNHYKFWIVLSFLVVFAAGLFSGMLLDRYVLDGKATTTQKSRRDRRPRPRFPTVDDMAEELALTESQREDLRNVFNEGEQRIQGLHKEVRDMYGTLRTRFLDEIRNILTGEQGQRFDAMLERFAAQHREDIEKHKQTPKEPEQK